MDAVKRKEAERFSIGIVSALVLHLAVFLIAEYAGLLGMEDSEQYIGPVLVELADATSIPEMATIESPEVVRPDTPALDEPEDTVADPSAAEPEAVETPEQDTTGEGQAVEVAAAKTDAPAVVPESAPKTTPRTSPPPKTAPVVVDESLFSGRDTSNTFKVAMNRKSDKAKPVFRLPVQLPNWVASGKVKLEVILSFITGPNGDIIELHVDKSSGFDDVDSAVTESVRQWKFSNPITNERIMGTLTYGVNR